MPTTDQSREQLFYITLTMAGKDLGVWDKWDGGGKDTNSSKYTSGGQPDEESLGGNNTYPDLTISRGYRLARDGAIIGFLLTHTGSGIITAHKTPMDRSYNHTGPTVQAIGSLKTFTDVPVDSTSNNAAVIALVMEPNSYTVI